MSLRTNAIGIATKVHKGQTKNGWPYIDYVREVADRVERAGLGVEAVVVAWLHDVMDHDNVNRSTLLDAGIPEHLVDDVEDLNRDRVGMTQDEYIVNLKYGSSDRARLVKVHALITELADNPTTDTIRRCSVALEKLTFDFGEFL
jgi:(p)ppGpp synthase/HD superfamily hydrolase